MNFFFDVVTNEAKFNAESYEYSYEDDKCILILDINQSKLKASSVENNIRVWLNHRSNHKAETLFRGGYFMVYYHKINKTIEVYRDASGIKSGYYSINKKGLFIDTHVHSLAKTVGVSDFDEKAIAMLLALDFCFDGYTIYKDIKEFKIGIQAVFNSNLECNEVITPVQLATKENTLSFNENANRLREETNSAHSSIATTNNIVYLSGGIDSCVMLAALDDIVDKKDIKTISYKVKGTTQDETIYAKSIADYLGVSFEVKEIDPKRNITVDFFQEAIIKMNNPYIGYWIFAPEGDLTTTFFAGQDTRLHTPDVHPIDSFVFGLYLKNKKLPFNKITEKLALMVHNKLNLEKSAFKGLKHLDRLSSVGNPENYILKYVFKFKPPHESPFLISKLDELKAFFELPNAMNSKRQLYNEIVRIKWAEQYTDDIRYMQDIARVSSRYMAMPFYDKQLSEFSSSIPFDYASKFEYGNDAYSNSKVKVNKLILRAAYKDKLNREVLYRKKAVSVTNFLLFEGALGHNVYQIIREDYNAKESFIKEYKLERFVEKYYNKPTGWAIDDQNYLMKIYYIATLCIYFKHILK